MSDVQNTRHEPGVYEELSTLRQVVVALVALTGQADPILSILAALEEGDISKMDSAEAKRMIGAVSELRAKIEALRDQLAGLPHRAENEASQSGQASTTPT
ncbi:MAG: hypothetical protein QOF41_323 [Methylobacteriaceae bacterium]|nr:hypothetical protein [Methylobacteriaceae bacterium]